MDPNQYLNQLLSDAAISKIVYALVMPETECTIDAVLDGDCQSKDEGRERYHSLFREAWTQKQDQVHEGFFKRWKSWTDSVVFFEESSFHFVYPTAGASEGLREAIHAYGVASRKRGTTPRIHVFEGEYEGFTAYAIAAGIEVQTHSRCKWKESLDRVCPHEQFYISQPSAVDGFVWSDFDCFAESLYNQCPTAELMLDLTYVGCVARDFTVDASPPNVGAIFISLSKPAGVYYHRVGGVYSRREILGLFGNKWFKNISSLQIGTEFMKRFGVHELPRKYRPIQHQAVEEVNKRLGLSLVPADIMLLGVGESSNSPSDLERYLLRGSRDEPRVRVCLTPLMAHSINPKLNPHVSARYYEKIS